MDLSGLLKVLRFLAPLLLVGAAHAASTAVVTPGPWTAYSGTAIVRPQVDYVSQDACVEGLKKLQQTKKYTCRTSTTVSTTYIVDLPPVPAPSWVPVALENESFTVAKDGPVRFGLGDKWITKTLAAGTYNCNLALFAQDPVPNVKKVCQVNTLQMLPPVATVPVTKPDEGMSPGDMHPIAAPRADVGKSGLRVQTSGQIPAIPTDGTGSFRNPCAYSHMAFDDPIVYPGKPGASHLHVFFGNTSTDANSTTLSLTAANSSTCAGGTANLSGYWTAAIIDTSTNQAQVPGAFLFYYKSGYNQIPLKNIQPPPSGLRFIGGASLLQASEITSWSGSPNLNDVHHHFSCGAFGVRTQYIPKDCKTTVEVGIEFPNCWDGTNFDSPNHRSHMAYSGGGTCPSSHPVPIPVVSLNIVYPVRAGQDTSKWRLSSDGYDITKPGGYTMHGDIWFNWNDAIAKTWTSKCVAFPMDCHAFAIGDGRELF